MFFSTSQIWDVGIKIQAYGIIVKGWRGTFIPLSMHICLEATYNGQGHRLG